VKTYKVKVYYKYSLIVEIKANSIDEAISQTKNRKDLQTKTAYIDDIRIDGETEISERTE